MVLAGEEEPSPPVETAPRADPAAQRAVSVPVRSVPARTKSEVVVPAPVHTTYEVPVFTTDVQEVSDQILMQLVVVELHGNAERALQAADFHELPGGHRYLSTRGRMQTVALQRVRSVAKGHRFGGDSTWFAEQLEMMKACAEVEVLSRPQVKALLGQPAQIQVGKELPQMAYLVRTGKKTFELREVVAKPTLGLTISLTAQSVADDPDQIEISPLAISTTTLDGREPIPGVDLDVGKPIFSTRKLETSMTLTDGGPTGAIMLPGPSGRQAVLFISVYRVPKGDRPILPYPVVEPVKK